MAAGEAPLLACARRGRAEARRVTARKEEQKRAERGVGFTPGAGGCAPPARSKLVLITEK
jgi:hypothetical protein